MRSGEPPNRVTRRASPNGPSPAVIDDLLGSRANAWLSAPGGLAALASEDGFREHVAELGKAAAKRDFGYVSDDLRDLLVDVALGSPAVCALRALQPDRA